MTCPCRSDSSVLDLCSIKPCSKFRRMVLDCYGSPWIQIPLTISCTTLQHTAEPGVTLLILIVRWSLLTVLNADKSIRESIISCFWICVASYWDYVLGWILVLVVANNVCLTLDSTTQGAYLWGRLRKSLGSTLSFALIAFAFACQCWCLCADHVWCLCLETVLRATTGHSCSRAAGYFTWQLRRHCVDLLLVKALAGIQNADAEVFKVDVEYSSVARRSSTPGQTSSLSAHHSL